MKRTLIFVTLLMIVGCTKELVTIEKLTPEQKLEQMITDRPSMKLEYGDSLRSLALEIFETVDWNPEVPFFESCITYSTPSNNGSISLQKMSPANSWFCFFYESFNIRYSRQFMMIHEYAVAGKITRDKYIESNAYLEWSAAQEFRKLARTVLFPYFEEKGYNINSELSSWLLYFEKDFSEWMKNPSPCKYPWNPWGDYYDKIVRSNTF
jgi:hypothetical protein